MNTPYRGCLWSGKKREREKKSYARWQFSLERGATARTPPALIREAPRWGAITAALEEASGSRRSISLGGACLRRALRFVSSTYYFSAPLLGPLAGVNKSVSDKECPIFPQAGFPTAARKKETSSTPRREAAGSDARATTKCEKPAATKRARTSSRAPDRNVRADGRIRAARFRRWLAGWLAAPRAASTASGPTRGRRPLPRGTPPPLPSAAAACQALLRPHFIPISRHTDQWISAHDMQYSPPLLIS